MPCKNARENKQVKSAAAAYEPGSSVNSLPEAQFGVVNAAAARFGTTVELSGFEPVEAAQS